MFTGIVTAVGTVTQVRTDAAGAAVEVELGPLASRCAIGDSIALSGVCCTVVATAGARARFDLSPETLERSWFGALRAGARLNLEAAVRAGDPLGGHLVQGHVDAVGEVVTPVGPDGGEWWIRIPPPYLRYCVEKGSITCDGVSLTIATIREDRLMLAIIPHTARATTLGQLPAGAPVNLEVDVLAKYVERLLAARFS